MDAIASFLSAVFWGVVLFSALVFVHEGGHFLAARACGARVTEFFLGLPCRFRLAWRSKRIGTTFGVTPFLLGGYAAICGMDPEEAPHAAAVLGAVHRRGKTTVDELAEELSITPEEALDACAFLMSWASVAPVYDASKGEKPSSGYYPSTYAAVPRDRAGLTVYDGRAFDRAHATAEGEPWEPPMADDAFLAQERSRTYMGKGFWKRAAMLLAGIGVNIVSGFLIMVFAYSVLGTSVARDVNVLGDVTAGSPAAEAGIRAGDRILSVDGTETGSWTAILKAIEDSGAKAGDAVTLECERDGAKRTVDVKLDAEGHLGIAVSTETVRISPLQAAEVTGAYLVQTAQGISQLFVPARTMEVLDNSSSIVGISSMASQAASEGPSTFLWLAALISFSLAFMNLLPIPPLDGGKLLIEVVQAVTRRTVPVKVQTYISYAGIALFGLLFLYTLRGDILRLI